MIQIIFTGGTISMRRDASAGGNVPALDGKALVDMAPGLGQLGPIRIDDWGRLPACHMGPVKLWELREHVRSAIADPAVRGVVITHGTDILEETAYLLARTLPADKPICLTGAMRTTSDEGWDGPANLTDAVRVAADPASQGRGTMVVFAGHILPGLGAMKVEATALEAFAAPFLGSVGRTGGQGGGSVVYDRPTASFPQPLNPPGLTARVAMIPMVVGDDGTMLDLARPHHDGVVIEAFGSGNLPPGAIPAIERWIGAGKPVILGTRCPRGEVTPVYAFEGGGATIIRRGAISAGPRTTAQARMELLICLSAGVAYGGTSTA
ncbi:MAG: asparaginase [Gemmatimonadota bacterium]